MRVLLIVFFVLVAIISPKSVFGQPRVCLGLFDIENPARVTYAKGGICPDNSVVLGLTQSGSSSDSAKQIGLLPYCCPLPSKDILTDEHVKVETECPESYVATGTAPFWRYPDTWQQPQLLKKTTWIRCTKININKYALSEPVIGASWGSKSVEWLEKYKINRAELPAAIRYGIGRIGLYRWKSNGCVSYPFGGIFVAKTNKYCKGTRFKMLEYRNTASEQKNVQLYPSCRCVNNYLSNKPTCEPM